MKETINHPDHYNTGKIEVIDFIEDKQLYFPLGNAVKYICRAGRKDADKEIEDLKKAVWYLNRKIEKLSLGLSDMKGRVDDPPLPKIKIKYTECLKGSVETYYDADTEEVIFHHVIRKKP